MLRSLGLTNVIHNVKGRTLQMITKDDSGAVFVSLKWLVGILTVCILSLLGGWGSQRLTVEAELANEQRAISTRLLLVEKNQAAVMARLDANAEKLSLIYLELKEHRATGK